MQEPGEVHDNDCPSTFQCSKLASAASKFKGMPPAMHSPKHLIHKCAKIPLPIELPF